MKAIQRIIYTGFAAVAFASAATPTFSYRLLPADVVIRGAESDRHAAPPGDITLFERR